MSNPEDDLIDEEAVSKMTGDGSDDVKKRAVKVSTLQQWRWNGRGGPPWYKFGRNVRYKRGEVRRWIEAQRTVPAADALSAQQRANPQAKQTPSARLPH